MRLLERSSQKLRLTEAGSTFHEHCAEVLARIAEAEAAVSGLQASPRGRLRVSAGMDFGTWVIGPLVQEFLQLHPLISVELVLSDRTVDLVGEGFDVAIRIGPVRESSRSPHMKSVTLTRAFGMLVLCVMVGCGTPETEVEANKALLHEYHQDIWVKGQLDAMPQYIAQDFHSHAVPDGSPQGIAPSTQFMQMVWSAFPDMQSHEDALFVEGDRVIIQWTIDATHRGNFLGVAATNKPIHISGMDVLRVQNGKFVEHWGGFGDQLDEPPARRAPGGAGASWSTCHTSWFLVRPTGVRSSTWMKGFRPRACSLGSQPSMASSGAACAGGRARFPGAAGASSARPGPDLHPCIHAAGPRRERPRGAPPGPSRCPECGGPPLARVGTASRIRLA